MTDDGAPPADPDELDFTDDESVVEIGERRYVVGTEGRPTVDPAPDPEPADRPGASDEATTEGATSAGGEVTQAAVNDWLEESFDDDGFTYGVDLTLHAEGDTARHRLVSNDVTATFDALCSWFVAAAGPESPPPEALGLLLAAVDSPVDVPPGAIKAFAATHDLAPDDSIADLVRAAENAGGFRID